MSYGHDCQRRPSGILPAARQNVTADSEARARVDDDVSQSCPGIRQRARRFVVPHEFQGGRALRTLHGDNNDGAAGNRGNDRSQRGFEEDSDRAWQSGDAGK